jgi:hypothetical protein
MLFAAAIAVFMFVFHWNNEILVIESKKKVSQRAHMCQGLDGTVDIVRLSSIVQSNVAWQVPTPKQIPREFRIRIDRFDFLFGKGWMKRRKNIAE